MTAMGIGRIITPEESLVLPYSRQERRVRMASRRLFLQGGGIVLAGGLVGCGNNSGYGGYSGGDGTTNEPGIDWSYLLTTVGVAVADIAGVYFMGVPLGTLVSGVVRAVDAGDSADPRPNTVTITHKGDPQTQGQGTVQYDMPRGSDVQGVSTLDTQGLAWVHKQNPYGDDIEHVSLVSSNGDEIFPQNTGLTGFIPDLWRPGADLYIAGVPMMNYKSIRFQTKSGQKGEINL